ncbi:MAG: transglutaminase-like domain-containing protein [Candidatus Marinimicrobia bacterium]|nr:transglutaminase-like domain-containing protein [Candidatus Neomarinimicrobiota bacterium]MCF7851366.1 transglutaminase-like domain-containing protein [Candidatus Neomarinimicrobiota bacterium]MCF7904200.1 transglutaminase-like domain-containing protein [Candidatus Neomarinimicrobiota bacterium]
MNKLKLTAISIALLLIGNINMCSMRPEGSSVSTTIDNIYLLIERGEYTEATESIQALIEAGQVNDTEKQDLLFQVERMDRIRKDFDQTREEVVEYLKGFYPELTDEDMTRWEQEKSLECKVIDGEKWYFARAGRNLFRIDKGMRELWKQLHPDAGLTSGSGAGLDLDKHNMEIIETAISEDKMFVHPKRLRIKQSIKVKPDMVPEGELLKCWIPYPRYIPNRQVDIKLIASWPEKHIIAPESALQRTIYFEAPAQQGEFTEFMVEYEMTSHGVYVNIDPEQVLPTPDDPELKPFLAERLPHIQFTDDLKRLSEELVGDETNPYRIAQKLFAWVDENTPWASAREYSTIQCIPQYALENGHGDCGIQTLQFMTLCRMNGIPTRWQSGWELQPPNDSMHDWGMIYFHPYGWVPMDATYGLRDSEDQRLRWFYLSGMDSYRIIYNDDFSQPFTPPKTHFRSETVDSQRGEVEWSEGNLYFDQWRWSHEWEVLE